MSTSSRILLAAVVVAVSIGLLFAHSKSVAEKGANTPNAIRLHQNSSGSVSTPVTNPNPIHLSACSTTGVTGETHAPGKPTGIVTFTADDQDYELQFTTATGDNPVFAKNIKKVPIIMGTDVGIHVDFDPSGGAKAKTHFCIQGPATCNPCSQQHSKKRTGTDPQDILVP